MNAETNSNAPAGDANYHGLDFGPAELRRVMQETYADVIAFVRTPQFVAFYEEMISLEPQKRPAFIAQTLFQPEELKKSGIVVPEGISSSACFSELSR